MAVITPGPAALDLELLSAYYTKDRLIGNLPLVIFHGPSTTTNSTLNSSRIQAHVFSIAGLASYPRLTISPTSPLYLAVHQLPEEQQGDEVYRGLAVSLLKYFSEMPATVKTCLQDLVAKAQADRMAPPMFDEAHAARLAGSLVKVENTEALADHIRTGTAEKSLSWIDLDVILPHNAMPLASKGEDLVNGNARHAIANEGEPLMDYGDFTELVNLFGSPSFLPSAKLRRAPSKPLPVHEARSISREVVEEIQREMTQLLDTEEGYVSKLYDLVASVASVTSESKTPDVSHSERVLRQLFSGSLPQIVKTNAEFLGQLQALIVSSEDAQDAFTDGNSQWITERDPTGTDSFARLLLQFIPRFQGPYQEYLRVSSSFQKILNEVMRDSVTAFAQCLQGIGEQRLRSLLIEPVQRLPRYSLYIDNILKQLPASHVSVAKLLKAKDLVTEICALDSEPAGSRLTVERLTGLVSRWPRSLEPWGRLITVIDAIEISPPYRVLSQAREGTQSFLLLFPSCVLVLRKQIGSTLSARGLFAEIDRPASAPSTLVLSQPSDGSLDKPLNLVYHFSLEETRFTESQDEHVTSAASFHKSSRREQPEAEPAYVSTGRCFYLTGSYEGKAGRWSEDVAKARVEERFPESFRDSEKWELRSRNPETNSFGLLSAIFEHDTEIPEDQRRRRHGQVEVVLTKSGSGAEEPRPTVVDSAADIAVVVTVLEPGKYQLEFRGQNNHASTDFALAADFMAVFLKRLGNLLRLQNQPSASSMIAQAHLSYMQKIADTLRPQLPIEEGSARGRFRPPSPVKALSNLLAGPARENTTPSRSHVSQGSIDLMNKPLPPLGPPVDRHESKMENDEDSKMSKVTIVHSTSPLEHGSIDSLETTLNTYIIALHSRAGNIVGRVLRNRRAGDELKVNELYNAVIEDPGQHQAAAEVPIDVLFAAFEKFLNRAWKDRIGPLLSDSTLRKTQNAFQRSTTGRVRTDFRMVLEEMAPQNSRAFSAIIRLLSHLLEAAGNDGDRGALTVSFAEALVEEHPLDYITLFDRLVEDVEALFDGTSPIEVAMATSAVGASDKTPARTLNSYNSAGSSFRKRFGLGVLTRENSKNDTGESRVGQIWRSLSKKASGDSDSAQGSLTKSFLSRSKSTDSPRLGLSRPGSRDRPVSSHSTLNENMSRPLTATSTNSRMQTPPAALGLAEQDPNKLNKAGQPPRTPSPSKLQKLPPPTIPQKVQSNRKENVKENVPPQLTLPPQIDFSTTGAEFFDKQQLQSSPAVPERKSSSPQKLKVQSPQKVAPILLSSSQMVLTTVAP